MNITKIIIYVITIFGWSGVAYSQDKAQLYFLKPGALFCKTRDYAIDAIESKTVLPECQLTEDPIWAKIFPEGIYRTRNHIFRMVRYNMIQFGPNDEEIHEPKLGYGFWGKSIPDYPTWFTCDYQSQIFVMLHSLRYYDDDMFAQVIKFYRTNQNVHGEPLCTSARSALPKVHSLQEYTLHFSNGGEILVFLGEVNTSEGKRYTLSRIRPPVYDEQGQANLEDN